MPIWGRARPETLDSARYFRYTCINSQTRRGNPRWPPGRENGVATPINRKAPPLSEIREPDGSVKSEGLASTFCIHYKQQWLQRSNPEGI
jgi:hypothetical protein